MYAAGDMVMHAGTGVCKIDEIRKENFGENGGQEYYVLRPIYENKSQIFVPVEKGDGRMRNLLSEEEIYTVLDTVPECSTIWVSDDRARQEKFSQVLHAGNRADVIKLISELHEKRREVAKRGKRLHFADQHVLEEAEKIVNQEVAYVFHLDIKDVPAFIMNRLGVQVSKVNS